LFGVDSIQSSPSHRIALIGNEVHAWAQNSHGEFGTVSDSLETHNIGYVTTIIITDFNDSDDDLECTSHSNGKNQKGNQVDFCKTGFENGKGHHK